MSSKIASKPPPTHITLVATAPAHADGNKSPPSTVTTATTTTAQPHGTVSTGLSPSRGIWGDFIDSFTDMFTALKEMDRRQVKDNESDADVVDTCAAVTSIHFRVNWLSPICTVCAVPCMCPLHPLLFAWRCIVLLACAPDHQPRSDSVQRRNDMERISRHVGVGESSRCRIEWIDGNCVLQRRHTVPMARRRTIQDWRDRGIQDKREGDTHRTPDYGSTYEVRIQVSNGHQISWLLHSPWHEY